MTEQQNINTHFEIAYCFQLESLTEIFNRRLEKLLIFMQFILGSAVVTDYFPSLLLGLLIAIIAGLQFSLKPGEIAGNARQQKQRYRILLDEAETKPADTIRDKLYAIEKTDSVTIGSFNEIARLNAARMIGITPDARLSTFEKCVAIFCGQSVR